MPITKLQFARVGPFEDIEFDFDRQVNVFVGPNNSGKTSVLSVLGDVVVYPFQFPLKILRQGLFVSQFTVAIDGPNKLSLSGTLPHLIPQRRVDGSRTLDEEQTSQSVRFLSELGYSTFVPALRVNTDFRSRGPTPTIEEEEATSEPATLRQSDYQVIFNPNSSLRKRRVHPAPLQERYPELAKRRSLLSANAALVSDEEVIQHLIDLDYRFYLKKDKSFNQLLTTICNIASDITDSFPLVFSGIKEDDYGFFPEFDTVDGPLSLNRLSQGTQSTFQWLSRLIMSYAEYYDFTSDFTQMPGVLMIDEIDAHLHPSWQRRIIPALTQHLPNLQIFCSTHSPLMLAGLKQGQIHLLNREEGQVTVTRNSEDIIAWSADEILRQILHVNEPTDLETTKNLSRLNDLEMKQDPSRDEVIEREELRERIDQHFTASAASVGIRRLANTIFNLEQASSDDNPIDSGRQH